MNESEGNIYINTYNPEKAFRNAGARITGNITEGLLRCLKDSSGTIKEQ